MEVIVVSSDGSRWKSTLGKKKKYVGWRCLHEAEGGYDSDSSGQPEIRPAFRIDSDSIDVNPTPVIFNKPLQLLSWEANTYNLLFSKGNWRSVYSTTTAFTNGQGFGEIPNKRDYVTPKDLLNPEDPKLMKGLICGGMFLIDDGYDSEWIYVSPGVSAIPAYGPYPSKQEMFDRNWYFEATTQFNGKMSHFPQGHGSPVWIPYVLRERCKFPKSWFVRWEEDFLPDPLKIYNPVQ